jgi:thioredoxin 1
MHSSDGSFEQRAQYLSEPQKAEQMRLKGNEFYGQRKFHEAINCYTDSINTHVTSKALMNLGLSLSAQGPTQYRVNAMRCLIVALALVECEDVAGSDCEGTNTSSRGKILRKFNKELVLSGDVVNAMNFSEGRITENMDLYTPKKVRDMFEKIDREDVLRQKVEERLIALQKSLRQIYIGRETGNACFKRGEFEDAKNAYTAGINQARKEFMVGGITPGVSILLCNRSLMKSKLKDLQGALEDSKEAIAGVVDGEVNYVKAILRKADALKKLGLFEEAFESYFLCWTRLPGDENVANELNECVERTERKNKDNFKAVAGPRACTSMREYEALITNHELVLVDFHAKWCGPCKQIAPAFARMNLDKYRNVLFLKVDVDEVQEIAAREQIQAMPTFILYRYGVKMDVMKGADINALDKLVQRWMATI